MPPSRQAEYTFPETTAPQARYLYISPPEKVRYTRMKVRITVTFGEKKYNYEYTYVLVEADP